jgi:hypothetical protein
MKRICLSILLSLCVVAGSAQKAPLTDQQIQKMKLDPKQNDSCVRRSYKSFSARLKNYPFNRAASVQLVSFRGRPDSVEDDYKNGGIPKANDSICYTKLKEIKALNFVQVDAFCAIILTTPFYLLIRRVNHWVISNYALNAVPIMRQRGFSWEKCATRRWRC